MLKIPPTVKTADRSESLGEREYRLRDDPSRWEAADQKPGYRGGCFRRAFPVLPQYGGAHETEHKSHDAHRLDQRIEIRIGQYPAFLEFLESCADCLRHLERTGPAWRNTCPKSRSNNTRGMATLRNSRSPHMSSIAQLTS